MLPFQRPLRPSEFEKCGVKQSPESLLYDCESTEDTMQTRSLQKESGMCSIPTCSWVWKEAFLRLVCGYPKTRLWEVRIHATRGQEWQEVQVTCHFTCRLYRKYSGKSTLLESWLCHLLILCLSFLVCKTREIVYFMQSTWILNEKCGKCLWQ
jgi:hypothetical protein